MKINESNNNSDINYFEELPSEFIVRFNNTSKDSIIVYFNNEKIGDELYDNNYSDDFYRFHDVFHFSYATLLNWSPCVRALLRRKRKSNTLIDNIEDGARAINLEEGITALIFSELKEERTISKNTIRLVKRATKHLEVGSRTEKEWKNVFKKAYDAFEYLVENNGGSLYFNSITKSIEPVKNNLANNKS